MTDKKITSLNVSAKFWKELKIHAVTLGISISELIEKAVTVYMENHKKENK